MHYITPLTLHHSFIIRTLTLLTILQLLTIQNKMDTTYKLQLQLLIKTISNTTYSTQYSQLLPPGHPAITDVRYYGQNSDLFFFFFDTFIVIHTT